MGAICCDKENESTIASKPVIADDGTKLYSLMQTSDRPIIHVSLNAFPSDGIPLSPVNSPLKGKQDVLDMASASAGDIVLAASDTLGVVHIYAPEKIDPHPTTPMLRSPLRELVELPHHPLYEEYRNRAKTDDDVHKWFRAPLVRVGEQKFSAAVVACAFPPAYPPGEYLLSGLGSMSGRSAGGMGSPGGKSVSYAPRAMVDRWDPVEMQQRSGPLLVGIAKGQLIMYGTEDLAALAQQYKRSMTEKLEGVPTLDSLPRGGRSVRQDDDTISECSVDSDIRDSDRKFFSHHSKKKIAKMSFDAAVPDVTIVSESDNDSRDELWARVAAKQAERSPKSKGSTTDTALKTTTTTTSTSVTTKKSSFLQQQEEEDSAYPRSRPPPPPTPTSSSAVSGGRPALRVQLDVPNGDGSLRSRAAQGTSSSQQRQVQQRDLTSTASTAAAARKTSHYGWDSPVSSQSSPTAVAGQQAWPDSMSAHSASEPSTPLPSPPCNYRSKSVAATAPVLLEENPLATPVETYSKVYLPFPLSPLQFILQ